MMDLIEENLGESSLESCPFLKRCEVSVTKDVFNRICNTKSHPNCYHYARRTNGLKTPFQWIQHIVVEQYKELPETVVTLRESG